MKAIKDIFCPSRNIADDSKEKAQPTDIVDIFWEYKQDDHNLNSRDRDFLRHTNIGYWYMTAQILRPYMLLGVIVYCLLFPEGKVNLMG